jgi:hypothetical protein
MMKLIICIFILSFFLNCSSNNRVYRPDYEIINDIWSTQGDVQDIVKNLGKPNIFDSEKVEYLFPNSKVPKIHFKLKPNGKVESALLFLEESRIDEFKSFINCQWSETKGQKQISDAIYLTHEGRCKDIQVRFNYFSSLRSYEIWWGSKLEAVK